MPLGDRHYGTVTLGYPIDAEPRFQFGDDYGGILERLYFHAQQHAIVVCQQPYGFDLRGRANDLATTRRSFGTTSYVGLARARRRLPPEFNHLWALVSCGVVSGHSADLYLRLTVSNGATDQAESITTVQPSAMSGYSNQNYVTRQDGTVGAQFAYQPRAAHVQARVDLDLSNVDPAAPGLCRVTLEGYAIYPPAAAMAVYPYYAAIFAGVSYG